MSATARGGNRRLPCKGPNVDGRGARSEQTDLSSTDEKHGIAAYLGKSTAATSSSGSAAEGLGHGRLCWQLRAAACLAVWRTSSTPCLRRPERGMRRQQDSVSESRALLACHAGVQSFEIQFNLVVGCDVIGEMVSFQMRSLPSDQCSYRCYGASCFDLRQL